MLSRALLLTALLGITACASPPSTDTAVSPASSTPVPPVATGSPPLPTAAASTPGAPASGPVAASNDYRIGPQDLLKLDVFGVEALSKRSVRVNASGQISLPLIGTVRRAA